MSKKISIVLFAFIIVAIPVISLLSPYKTESEQENRTLAAFPKFSFEQVVSKKFMTGFGSFVSDHIAFRDQWVAVKAGLITLTGKRDNQREGEDRIYLGNNCLIDDIKSPNAAEYQPNINEINEFAKSSGKPVFLMLAPTAAEIERDRLPPFATTYDQSGFLSAVKKNLRGVKLINTIGALSAHKSEYIYYRTDHHWTSLGAYYAYAAAGSSLGYTPLARSSFDVSHETDSFNGTLYSTSGYRSVTPDTIDFYTPKTGSALSRLVIGTGSEAKTYNSIYFKNWLSVKDKYSSFFDGNQPYEDIRTTSSGKRLLVFKDSYAHSLVPFLMNNYSRITMVDLRCLVRPINEVVNLKNYDQVLFVYNVDTFNTDTTINRVNP
jgi:hypothetical protein